jgi:hypothetical protein
VKEGQITFNKHVLEKKLKTANYELDLLNKSTTKLKRFNNNFVPKLGTKSIFELKLALLGQGKMVGDYEAIFNCPLQSTIIC